MHGLIQGERGYFDAVGVEVVAEYLASEHHGVITFEVRSRHPKTLHIGRKKTLDIAIS